MTDVLLLGLGVAGLYFVAALRALPAIWADAHHPLDPRSLAEPPRPAGRHAVTHRWRPTDLIPRPPTHLIGATTC